MAIDKQTDTLRPQTNNTPLLSRGLNIFLLSIFKSTKDSNRALVCFQK